MMTKGGVLRLLLLLSPTVLRRGQWTVICRCVAEGIGLTAGDMEVLREVVGKRLAATPQVWCVAYALKREFGGGMIGAPPVSAGCMIDVYDATGGGVLIIDTAAGSGVTEGDLLPLVSPSDDCDVTDYDFTVFVPSGSDMDMVYKVVDAYVLPNMRYVVCFYNRV